MAVRLSATIPDLRGLQLALQDIEETPRRGILLTAGRIALKPLVAEARRRAPVRSGQLRKSIGISAGRRRGNKYAANLVVSPRTSGKFDGWYAHIVEGGSKGIIRNKSKRGLKKGSRFRADIAAKPFFEPAVQATVTEVGQIYSESINTALQRKIKSLQKKAAKSRIKAR